MADIDLGEVAEKEIDKRDRKIKSLENNALLANAEIERLKNVLKAIKKAKDALVEAADWIDPYRYDDD